jgi:hypothetical protein
MGVQQVERYRCQNPFCRAEIETAFVSTGTTPLPRCSCGASMKKVYTPLVLRKLTDQPAAFAWVTKKGKQA